MDAVVSSRHDGPPVVDSIGGLTASQFSRLAAVIQDYCGIQLPPVKKSLLEGRLRRRVRELGLSSLGDYCAFLFEQEGLAGEMVHVIDAITTNKTDFFREPRHFQLLRDRVLPQLLADGRRNGRDPLKIWSAASSTGAEPYTIAMVLADALERRGGGDFLIHATDICTQVLRQAMRGVYSLADVEPVPADFRRRFLLRARDPARREVRVAPALRARLRFSRLNLMDEDYAMPADMDVIFCRNVLIYFDRETQRRVVGHLCRHLRPGGFLFVGHTESLAGHSLPLTQVAMASFQRHAG